MQSEKNRDARLMAPRRKIAYEIWVPAVYLVVASLYIYFSDAILVFLAGSPDQIRRWSTIKGWLYVLVTAALLYGILARAFGKLADNEDRLRALNRELYDSQQRLSAIIENARAIFWLKDPEGRFLMVNQYCENVMNLPRDRILGKTVFDLFDRETALVYAANDREVLQSGQTREFEEQTGGASGIRTYLSVKFPLRREDGQIYALGALCTDITALKRAEESASRTRAEIAHLSRIASVGEMASSIAHELNQPLTSIVCYAGLCADVAAQGPEDPRLAKMLPHIKSIADEARRAAEIIRRLRVFVRKHVPHKQRMDINNIVRDAMELMKFELHRAMVTPELDLPEGLPAVAVDPIQIQQVLVNLCQNALDAMDKVPADSRRLVLKTSPVNGSGRVKVSVIDGGEAIDNQFSDRLFESFFTTKPNGLGLGLGICRSIIEDHGGRIDGLANPDRGMTFEFVLPAGNGA